MSRSRQHRSPLSEFSGPTPTNDSHYKFLRSYTHLHVSVVSAFVLLSGTEVIKRRNLSVVSSITENNPNRT